MHSRCSCATGCPYACSCTFAWSSHSAISLRESDISQSLSRISAPICLSDTGRQVRLSYILTHTTWTCSHVMLCVVRTLDLLDWVFSGLRFHTHRCIMIFQEWFELWSGIDPSNWRLPLFVVLPIDHLLVFTQSSLDYFKLLNSNIAFFFFFFFPRYLLIGRSV